MQGRKFT